MRAFASCIGARKVLRPHVFLLVFALVASATAELAAAPIDFDRQVRPILSNHCFRCHGPDSGNRMADLRLDTPQGADGVRGVSDVIAPGDVEQSELFNRISTDDESVKMPPVDENKPLTSDQIAILKQWITEGAKWADHWAYRPPQRPPVPTLDANEWVQTPVDAFVLARTSAERLVPSPQADPRTLVRRLYFDLLGLPPDPNVVDAFVKDPSDARYQALVDELLASPHFGERMAVYWLDLVRYADTNGMHGDAHREHAPYRDYVIASFNSNKPFNQFTLEQLAGDLLSSASQEQLIASGYNRLNMTTMEGGAQPREYQAKYAADRVRNVSTVWLGATLGCAECHDHKFDPYTSRDFYSMAAFFADVEEIPVGAQNPTRVLSDQDKSRLQAIDAQIGALQAEMRTPTPAIAEAQRGWEQTASATVVPSRKLADQVATSESGQALQVLADRSILALLPERATDSYSIRGQVSLIGATALMLEVLPDESLPARGPGRATNGNFTLNEIELYVEGQPVRLSNPSATFSQEAWHVSAAVDGIRSSGWGVFPRIGEAQVATFELPQDLPAAGDQEREVTVALRFADPGAHALGRFRISFLTIARPVQADKVCELPPQVAYALSIPEANRGANELSALAEHYRQIGPEFAAQREHIAELTKSKESIVQQAPLVLVTSHVEPRTTRILPGGNWMDESGEVLLPAVPPFLAAGDPPTTDRLTRQDLAKWLTAPDHPAVARVFVNRVWKLLFGHGIVRTLDDFGAQGARPTHPELLDWLAAEFIESGWDVKKLVRLIVSSSAYRQSSNATDDALAADPENQLLARQTCFRLDAEFVRDNALAASGLLSRELNGRSVFPYQPQGYWDQMNYPMRTYEQDHGGNLYRRGLYTYWARTFVHPSLLAFGAPSREDCTVDRPRSNIPQQALALLNDPTYVEAARVLASRVLSDVSSDRDRIGALLNRTLARDPSTSELAILESLLAESRASFSKDPDAASKLVSFGETPRNEQVPVVELAAWTQVARVVLNLHESITRY